MGRRARLPGPLRPQLGRLPRLPPRHPAQRRRRAARPGGSPACRDRPPRGVLLLGSDSRSGANRAYGRDEGNARSDTAMVVHIAKGRRDASVISIPRDTLVDRPACPTKSSVVPAARAVMFNSAYEAGGVTCTVATVELLSGLRMDHVVEIDFTGFKKLVDTLGGVRVDVPQDIRDPYSHARLSKGTQRLNGEQALGLVRTRHGVGDGSDLGRIKLQQTFMKALITQIRSTDLLTDPVLLYQLLDDLTSALTTDKGLGSLSALTSFARSVDGLDADQVDFRTLPVAPAPQDPNRVVPQQPQAKAVWQALSADRPLPTRSEEGGQ
ncbi:LytR family transcriptional regulator [Streptomyces phyllanthi]|uniref:LytR family transcriptional regulator n=2 Tax=Streptomyces phyllanthi TaxID=1803180 RepID=A0A5N8W312_9ACTN|nr:LytR family transcriptional regulator [Streptomyces phyllanthi]